MRFAFALSLLVLVSTPLISNALPTVPKTDLEYWNRHDGLRGANNCYNYATNRVTNSFAQPGEASGAVYDALTCESVYSAASKDLGLFPSGFVPFSGKGDKTLIALVVDPYMDFHWYRRDDNGLWTHKNGAAPAQDDDENGEKITSPETANRGAYTDFCGYFQVRNFPDQDHEQDAGQVRIGDMTRMPPDPNISSLEILKYSGRPDPRFSLKQILQSSEYRKELQSILKMREEFVEASELHVFQMSKLGYRGVLVNDHEGLIFPKGSRVQIYGRHVLAFWGRNPEPEHLTLPKSLSIELNGEAR